MNVERSAVINRITENCDSVRRTKLAKTRFADRVEALYTRYGIPRDKGANLLSLQEDLEGCSNWTLYVLTDVVLGNNAVKEYFTQVEIKEFGNYKSKNNTVETPIAFNAVKVSDDQWICSVDIRRLTALGNAGYIYYNENTQRALTRVVKDGEERYAISLNKKAVKDIKTAYEEGNYIPNTITLNIPQDAEVEYNEKTCILTVDGIDHFDILDGYHRYVAFGQICSINPDFNYPMELRLTQFNETKARQFIWQEDQKTKMKRLVSDSYNQTTYSSQVVSVLRSLEPIGMYIGTLIDESTLNKAIAITRPKALGKAKRSDILDAANKLAEKAKYIETSNPRLFDEKWDDRYVLAFVFANADSVDSTYDKMIKSGEFKNEHPYEAEIRRAKRYV